MSAGTIDRKPPTVALFTNVPTPYRDQLFGELRPLVGQLDVYYTEAATTDRLWQTEPLTPEQSLPVRVRLSRTAFLNKGVVGIVRAHDVVVVGGYEQPTYMLALLVARLLRRRTVIFYDGIAPSRFDRRGPTIWLKRVVVRLAHVCLVNGTIGRRYFHERLHVPLDRLRNQVLVPLQFAANHRAAERSSEAVTEPTCDVLYIGRLIPGKNVDLLIRALQLAPDLSAVIGGSGPMEATLKRLAEGLDVTFTGELAAAEIPRALTRTRCLVIPARDESWGLVVHEAMQFDVPVVAGVDMGCTGDLIVDGVNGVVLADLEPAQLLSDIRRALALDREALAARNLSLLSTWSLPAHVQAFRDTIWGDVSSSSD